MYTMMGPQQIGGVERWLGFRSRRARDQALREVRADPAMWDGLGPDAIIDREPGRYRPVIGSDADCAALARATRGAR